MVLLLANPVMPAALVVVSLSILLELAQAQEYGGQMYHHHLFTDDKSMLMTMANRFTMIQRRESHTRTSIPTPPKQMLLPVQAIWSCGVQT